ncbi:BCD family MFS transporter [Aurantiacibacter sediminis]|uniref:BCD family MFS transporter n=1 Tax=Aurantiacibacter sediminis TaxID=2793064 RepID=A0ABS0N1Z4_9SPHN|nr:BCD family MFS transporter [Aurantiacibacter sediminis]MBH5321967.1 BCD family MFS transporter [Aurantiacibacter sediminis]
MDQGAPISAKWTRVASAFLPFADAASADLPLGRLMRLALFQVSVGMCLVLLNGTLNRVMIVELGIPAWLVATMIAIPLLVAPFRAALGHRSDTHRSVLGWRRVPYIWFGSLMQFGGLAIMPFALLLMSRPEDFNLGVAASMLAFVLAGAGMHTTQTAGLALATDLAPKDKRPRAVALLYVMLLVGMMFSAFIIGSLLHDFSPTRLVQVIQGAAVLTMVLNVIALWKQEARNRALTDTSEPRPAFKTVWQSFAARPNTLRLLTAIGLGTMAFAMQDALLEPFGGEVLGMSVGATTGLTGAWAFGALVGFTLSARYLSRNVDPLRLSGTGAVIGIAAFMMILFASPLGAPLLLFGGALAIGLGVGLFSVGTLCAAMELSHDDDAGLALGAWGAVQATAMGAAIALGGIIRDAVSNYALADAFGATLAGRATGYGTVYMIEIILLLGTLAVLGPLVGKRRSGRSQSGAASFGLQEFPT